jgi:hypothetical protein
VIDTFLDNLIEIFRAFAIRAPPFHFCTPGESELVPGWLCRNASEAMVHPALLHLPMQERIDGVDHQ